MLVRTSSDGKYIYSVDLMFLYVNQPKIHSVKIRTSKILKDLKSIGWGDPLNHRKRFSAKDVLKHPEKYPEHYERIIKADLRYPVIIDGRKDKTHYFNIIDGVHRLSKAFMKKKEHVRAYIFDADLMKKFIVGKANKAGYKATGKFTKAFIRKLFRQRFT